MKACEQSSLCSGCRSDVCSYEDSKETSCSIRGGEHLGYVSDSHFPKDSVTTRWLMFRQYYKGTNVKKTYKQICGRETLGPVMIKLQKYQRRNSLNIRVPVSFSQDSCLTETLRQWILILSRTLTHCGRVTQICVFNTVKLGTSASSP